MEVNYCKQRVCLFKNLRSCLQSDFKVHFTQMSLSPSGKNGSWSKIKTVGLNETTPEHLDITEYMTLFK